MKLKKYKFYFHGNMIPIQGIDDEKFQGKMSAKFDGILERIVQQQNELVNIKIFFTDGERGQDFDHALNLIFLAYEDLLNAYFCEQGGKEDFDFDYYEIEIDDRINELTEYQLGFIEGIISVVTRALKILCYDIDLLSTNNFLDKSFRRQEMNSAMRNIRKTIDALLRSVNRRRED